METNLVGQTLILSKVQVQSAVLRMVNLSHTSMDTKLQVYSRIWMK